MSYFKLAFIPFLISFLFGANKVTVVSFEQLETFAALKTNDTLYIVNFWATWCDPCVKELPVFQLEHKKYASHKVKIIYVSMNAPRELGKVQDFVDNQKLEGQVLLLNGGNPNNWIDKLDSSWSGTIPATIMYKSGKKVYFREGDFTSESLEKVIQLKNK